MTFHIHIIWISESSGVSFLFTINPYCAPMTLFGLLQKLCKSSNKSCTECTKTTPFWWGFFCLKIFVLFQNRQNITPTNFFLITRNNGMSFIIMKYCLETRWFLYMILLKITKTVYSLLGVTAVWHFVFKVHFWKQSRVSLLKQRRCELTSQITCIIITLETLKKERYPKTNLTLWLL